MERWSAVGPTHSLTTLVVSQSVYGGALLRLGLARPAALCANRPQGGQSLHCWTGLHCRLSHLGAKETVDIHKEIGPVIYDIMGKRIFGAEWLQG